MADAQDLDELLAQTRAGLTQTLASGVHSSIAETVEEQYKILDLLETKDPQHFPEILARVQAQHDYLDQVETEVLDRLRQVDGPEDENDGDSDEPPAGN